LLRLTGDWGRPSKKARYLLIAPRQTVLGQKMELTIFEENIAEEPYVVWDYFGAGHGVLINGKAKQEELLGGLGFQFYPGEVRCTIYDLSKDITALGRYTIQYTEGEARSAVITIDVKAAKP